MVPGVDVRRQHPIAGQGGRPDAARSRPTARQYAQAARPRVLVDAADDAGVEHPHRHGVSGRSSFASSAVCICVLATYNAGDGRVRRWMPERPGLSAGRVHRRHPVLRDAGLRAGRFWRRPRTIAVCTARSGPVVRTTRSRRSTRTADASDVDPSLNTKKKPRPGARRSPDASSSPATPAPAKKRKRARVVSSSPPMSKLTARRKPRSSPSRSSAR